PPRSCCCRYHLPHPLSHSPSFLLPPPPPISPLFPYTTLFRSHLRQALLHRFQHALVVGRVLHHQVPAHGDHTARHRPHMEVVNRDRKSTRLNSSHGSISYAVFCLKKKIKICHAV